MSEERRIQYREDMKYIRERLDRTVTTGTFFAVQTIVVAMVIGCMGVMAEICVRSSGAQAARAGTEMVQK